MSGYQWSDGTPVQFTKWSPSEPNNAGGNEDCVEYNTYTNAWNDNSCYITNAFICSIPRGKPLVTTLTPPTTTPGSKTMMMATIIMISEHTKC